VDAKGTFGGSGGVFDGSLVAASIPRDQYGYPHGVVGRPESAETITQFSVGRRGGFVGVSACIDVSVSVPIPRHGSAMRTASRPGSDSIPVRYRLGRADTINVGLLSGIVTGDSVTYLKGAPANTAIGGLTDGKNVFRAGYRGGTFAPYDTKLQAQTAARQGAQPYQWSAAVPGMRSPTPCDDSQESMSARPTGQYTGLVGRQSPVDVGAAGAVNVGVRKNNVNAQIRATPMLRRADDTQVNALGINTSTDLNL